MQRKIVVGKYKSGHKMVYILRGSINVETTPELKTEILDCIQYSKTYVVIDLEEVESIDSKGLGFLVNSQLQLRQKGGELKVINPGAAITKVFRMTCLDRIFNIEDGQLAGDINALVS